ncbi:MAG: hypothetical protein ACREVV_08860 [Steroidobacteraceae bacterium]
MSSSDLSAAVQALLYDHIESYEQLEILLLLRLAGGESWSEEQISSRLNISSSLTAGALSALRLSGLVKLREDWPRYEYAADTQAMDDAVNALAAVYATHRFEIIKLMSANAIKRMRTGALRAFADAFLLHKDKGDG